MISRWPKRYLTHGQKEEKGDFKAVKKVQKGI